MKLNIDIRKLKLIKIYLASSNKLNSERKKPLLLEIMPHLIQIQFSHRKINKENEENE
jgi:hypothetical protein